MSERTVYRQVSLGKLRQFQRPIPGRKPLSVFDPDGVAKLAELALKARPEIMPPSEKGSILNPARVALQQVAYRQEIMETLNSVVFRHRAELAELPPSELAFVAYLSIQEAMRYSGLPEKTIQRLAREGKVQKIGTRYRRKDLEAL